MLKYKILLLTFIAATTLFAQNIEKVYLNPNETNKNHYTILYPPTKPYAGYVVIIPGFGETAESVLKQTDLLKLSANSGLLTVVPTLHEGSTSFGIDSMSQVSLEKIIQDVRQKNGLTNERLFLGGFSIGGSCAITYAQNGKIKPTAIFAIDPPVDFEQLYNSAKRDLRLSVNEPPNRENQYLISRIERVFGGSPNTAPANYHKLSPYSYSDTSQSAIKKLINMPIRIYAEPDIAWWMEQRGSDYTSMNVSSCSAMINELNQLGNKEAKLMISQNKGYRKPNNQRHPHAWSIVDNMELIEWMLRQE